MAQVKNPTADRLSVQLFGLIFEPGETKEVDDGQAAQLGGPLEVVKPAAAPVDPSATVEQAAASDESAAAVASPTLVEAQAEVEKAAADLAAAEKGEAK